MDGLIKAGAVAAAGLFGTAPLWGAVSNAAIAVSVTVAPNCSMDVRYNPVPPAVACSSAAPYTVRIASVPVNSVAPPALQGSDPFSTMILVTIAY